MVNRRSVLKVAASSVAGALVNIPGFGENAEREPTSASFQRAVFDERFAECRGFAAELRGTGLFSSAIRGDVAGLWYYDLRPQLNSHRAPFTGLTDRAALFCLEELARDVNMRVIVRVDHLIDETLRAKHVAVGSLTLVAATGSLTPNAGFGRAIARLISRIECVELLRGEFRESAAQKRTGPFSPHNKIALVSWIIA
jgi:hypothetical protein